MQIEFPLKFPDCKTVKLRMQSYLECLLSADCSINRKIHAIQCKGIAENYQTGDLQNRIT